MKIFITGGAGFIGSHLIRALLNTPTNLVLNFDKLTYAANQSAISEFEKHPNYQFAQMDLGDADGLEVALIRFEPEAVIHLAAESHVDRSIAAPGAFIQSNIVGTYHLLEVCRKYLRELPPEKQAAFRLLHVSTDEVFGSLGETGLFTEQAPYLPSSPYSASKAAADHLVRAWQTTYELPAVIAHASNTYGPGQFPEKLIPRVIQRALCGEPIPVYGEGHQVRDWLHVDDHVAALLHILDGGQRGQAYHIGGGNEWRNIDLVRAICRHLDELQPREDGQSYSLQITHVTDRPGHDFRYALDTSKIQESLGWNPRRDFESGLIETIQWYLANRGWLSC